MTRSCRLQFYLPFNRHGVTLIELVFAMLCTTIVSGIVYLTWNHINQYTLVQNRKSALRSECFRIAKQISNQLHKAEAILQWDPHKILFTTSLKNDTFSYSFDGTSLEYNNSAITLTTPFSTVQQFLLENANTDNETQPYLFTCTITLGNASGDTASVKTTVLIQHKLENNASDNNFVW
jgi:Tfp pilus assembly protein PilE